MKIKRIPPTTVPLAIVSPGKVFEWNGAICLRLSSAHAALGHELATKFSQYKLLPYTILQYHDSTDAPGYTYGLEGLPPETEVRVYHDATLILNPEDEDTDG